jgi:hypothetical protein
VCNFTVRGLVSAASQFGAFTICFPAQVVEDRGRKVKVKDRHGGTMVLDKANVFPSKEALESSAKNLRLSVDTNTGRIETLGRHVDDVVLTVIRDTDGGMTYTESLQEPCVTNAGADLSAVHPETGRDWTWEPHRFQAGEVYLGRTWANDEDVVVFALGATVLRIPARDVEVTTMTRGLKVGELMAHLNKGCDRRVGHLLRTGVHYLALTAWCSRQFLRRTAVQRPTRRSQPQQGAGSRPSYARPPRWVFL